MNTIKVKEIIDLKWDKSKLNPPTSETSRYNLDNILKNYGKDFDGTFEIIIEDANSGTNVELETTIGITNNFIIACECLGGSLYSGSVLFASIAVEVILNHDTRLEDHRRLNSRQWLTLTPNILQCAYNRGLPTNLLLGRGEKLGKNIKFIQKRNKVAHGDTEGYRKIIMSKSRKLGRKYENRWEPSLVDALSQIKKTRKFIDEWGRGKPSLILK